MPHKRKRPRLIRAKDALFSSPPRLLTDKIDPSLKVVNGTGVLSRGTHGPSRSNCHV